MMTQLNFCDPAVKFFKGFQRFDLNKSFREGSFGFSKPPDTTSSFIMIHQVRKDFKKGHQEPGQDYPFPLKA